MRALRCVTAALSAGLLSLACKDSTAPNGSPVAKFTATCNSLQCSFKDLSTGTIASWQWDFGDNTASTEQNPTHDYSVTTLDTMTAQLTVTDNGGATSTVTKTFTVAPPAALNCGGVGCDLVLDQSSIVTVTLQSSSCRAHGDIFVLTAPIVDTLFRDGCYVTPVPKSFTLNGGTAFNGSTHLQAEVISGSSTLAFPPTLRVTEVTPDNPNEKKWELDFDDGEGCAANDPACAEPDFNDLIITIVATPVP